LRGLDDLSIANDVTKYFAIIPFYGFGGIIIPFIGIKLIEMLISRLGLASENRHEEESNHLGVNDHRHNGPVGNH
jgi:hypothetical protein